MWHEASLLAVDVTDDGVEVDLHPAMMLYLNVQVTYPWELNHHEWVE